MAISEGEGHDADPRHVQPAFSEMDDVLTALRRRATFIAGVTLACVTLSLVYILLATPRYIATGRIDLGAASDVTGQMQAITSIRAFDAVIARERLDDDPLFGARSRGFLTELLADLGIVPTANSHLLARRLLGRAVSVARDPRSPVLTVSAVTRDPETSARIANAVMDSYVEDTARSRDEAEALALAPSDPSLEVLQGRLRDAEQRYRAYRDGNNVLGTGGELAIEKQVKDVAGQVAETDARVDGLRASLTQIQRARSDRSVAALPSAVRNRTIDVLGSRYVAARRAEADLSETLGPRHPDLRRARQHLSESRRLLDQAFGDIARSTASELERARSGATALRLRLESLQKDLAASRDTSIRLEELERDLEARRADYQAFLLKSQNAAEQQRAADAFPRIMTRALPPQDREGISPVLVLMASIIFGLGLAMSLAWLLELLNGQRGVSWPDVRRRPRD